MEGWLQGRRDLQEQDSLLSPHLPQAEAPDLGLLFCFLVGPRWEELGVNPEGEGLSGHGSYTSSPGTEQIDVRE